MKEINAESVDKCRAKSVMEYLESTQERSASVTAEYVKAEVLAKVSLTMSEKDQESYRASCVGNQAGHSQGSDREQT
jgi:hypothetical protein